MNLLSEIISDINGISPAGEAKSEIAFQAYTLNTTMKALADNEYEDSCICTELFVKIERHNEFIQIDLYGDREELDVMWQAIENYGKQMESYADSEDFIVASTIAIVPKESKYSNYYVRMLNPFLWTLQARKTSDVAPNTIRILGKAEDFALMEVVAEED